MGKDRSGIHQLRVGLIGAGKMGLHHLRAIGAQSGARVVGIADPLANREALGPLLPDDAIIVASAEELFEQAKPDVVHIVTPPHTHAPLADFALTHGAHVYVEKPFTLVRTEAEAVLAKAEAAGRRVCAGHQCLFQHQVAAARPFIDQIAPIVHVESYFSFRQVRRGMRPIDQAKDILPHAVYTLLDFMRSGRPATDQTQIVLNGLQAREDGGVYALLNLDGCGGVLVVTLTGRPVEHYARLIGRNGSIRIDFVTGAVVKLPGPGSSAVSSLLSPYRSSLQTTTGATRGFWRRIRDRKLGYPGLPALVGAFYQSVASGSPPPLSPQSILETVEVCETTGQALDVAEAEAEGRARSTVERLAAALPTPSPLRGVIFVTGGSGFLGRAVVAELRQCGWRVRSVSRRVPRYADRVPGVDYAACDIAEGVPAGLLEDVAVIAHCAAETAGGASDQRRNSIEATRKVIEAARDARIKRVLHISSLAVLQTDANAGGPIDENTALVETLRYGPYVWGKAGSERLACELGREYGLAVSVIRLGPLVDNSAFQPPGRLGRELGPLYVAIGPRRRPLSMCSVETAAQVIRLYVDQPEGLPSVLNLVEPAAPTRAELVSRLQSVRSDLRIFWVPFWVLRVVSPPLKLVQRLALGSTDPVDVSSAFASNVYATELAGSVIARAAHRGDAVTVSEGVAGSRQTA